MITSLTTDRDDGPSGSDRLWVADLEVSLDRTSADVVSEISFSLGAGEVLGLVGESGSGKTTIALALLGYARRGLSITKGCIRVEDTDLLSLSTRRLRSARGKTVAYVPQDPASSLNPALRVGVQLEEALRMLDASKSERQARLTQMLAEVHLEPGPETLRRYPHQLSGGQQQRVAIAMAFANRPSLIVLDEPTTGLDVSTQRHVLDTVRELCKSHGVAAVYVSHDLAVVSGLADKVVVMYAGRIVEYGLSDDVFERPRHPYTRGLIAAVPTPERAETLLGIEGQPPSPARRPPGCPYQPRCPVSVAACTEEFPVKFVSGRLVRCVRATDPTLPSAKFETHAVPTPPASRPASLTVDNLSASYGPRTVLHGVSFTMPEGQCLAVVGESGSGKTTLARCIVGLHPDWNGTVRFAESSLAGLAKQRGAGVLREVQYIFQSPYSSLNPRKTIAQTLEQPLKQFFDIDRAERLTRIDSAIRDVSLAAELLDRYPEELSGGQRQRVAIARALIVDPRLLVCDEVTSALDVSVQATVVELLRRLQIERGLSILFITHNVALVRSIAQVCVVLSQGQVVDSGTVEDVFVRPSDPYTVRLMQDVPKLTFK